jgi:hypothetical protein
MSQVQVTSLEEVEEAETTVSVKRPIPLWRNRDYVLLWNGSQCWLFRYSSLL